MNKEIDKKIAELMSRYGHPWSEPVYSKHRLIEECCLFISRWKYKLTEGLYFKIKYFLQRHIRGYDDLDKWNAAWYIARKAIPVLTAMRDKCVGTSIKWHREDRFGDIIELTRDEAFVDENNPPSFTEDEWRAILDDIIYAFQFTLDQDSDTPYNQEQYEKNYKRHKRGLKLFSIYYMNLWD
ncbi:MAG: hypothetical protein EBU90_18380 [Proteobacteria bacterium]|nr:hypothetical protein [Pseudomonadota bacterium]NBP13039.1 hypothetical protein [bacterium]